MEDNNTSSSASGAPIKLEDPSVTLTIRLIMQGKVSGITEDFIVLIINVYMNNTDIKLYE